MLVKPNDWKWVIRGSSSLNFGTLLTMPTFPYEDEKIPFDDNSWFVHRIFNNSLWKAYVFTEKNV